MAKGRRMKSKAAIGCAAIIMLPFAIVGAAAVIWMYYNLFQWTLAQGWTETPATLESLELRKPRKGKEGNSFRVFASYRYSVDGVEYSSERVDLYEIADSLGGFHQRTYDRLKPHLNVANGATCYVNPNDPSQSVLNRDSRWELHTVAFIFAAAFGSLGINLVPSFARMWRDSSVVDLRRSQFPEEPWKWHQRWEGGRIRSEQLESLQAWKLIACCFMVAVLPVALFSAMGLFDGNIWALIGLSTVPVTAWIVRVWLIRKAQFREYGIAFLRSSEFPLRIRGDTMLTIQFERGELPDGPVRADVVCVRQIRRNNRTRKETVWEDNIRIESEDCRIVDGGLRVNVPLSVPGGTARTDVEDNSVQWKLVLNVPTRTNPMSVQFVLPVF